MAESTQKSTPLDPTPDTSDKIAQANVHVPRISIQFCTQCRWMLRAAYFAQELLSTFGTDLGEVALVPKTGGVFTVTIWHGTVHEGEITTQESILWDRKRDGGFPEVKALKSLVRNVIAPDRDLGHTDRALKKEKGEKEGKKEEIQGKAGCEDCQ
ncbi:Selenoprotein, Rdx type [Penicillium italicum]|uniref:Selenoprotein, Rdx type n=1 Tax=Penicillium italicum TaxID=40296 RepID=A0A0A2L834_PENIT|nr:Selenoprotein, Rdx type [Penicillium italicum]